MPRVFLQTRRCVKLMLFAFAIVELGPVIVPAFVPASVVFAEVKTVSTDLSQKKRQRKKNPKKRKLNRKETRKSGGKAKRAQTRSKVGTKTLAAKQSIQSESNEGFGVFSVFFLLVVMAAAGYGIFIAYKRSHPEMEWDGIRSQDDTGLRPPGKTDLARRNFTKPKWRLLGRRGAENPHPAFGEEPAPPPGRDPLDEI